MFYSRLAHGIYSCIDRVSSFGGGFSLLVQLFASEEQAKLWMRIGGLLRQLTAACGLIYTLTIVLGAITLFPTIATDTQTAILLIIYGTGFAYVQRGCVPRMSSAALCQSISWRTVAGVHFLRRVQSERYRLTEVAEASGSAWRTC